MRSGIGATVGGVLVVLALVVAGCGEPPEDRIPGPRLLDELAVTEAATVRIESEGFDTQRVEVGADEVVVVRNADEVPHRVLGTRDGEGAGDGERAEPPDYDTGELLPGEQTVLRVPAGDSVVFALDEDPDQRFEIANVEPVD